MRVDIFLEHRFEPKRRNIVREMDMYVNVPGTIFVGNFYRIKIWYFFFRDIEKLKRFNVLQILIYRKFHVSKLI